MSEEIPADSEASEVLNGSSEAIHEDADTGEAEKSEKLTRLPIARIRTLIKADQDVTIASQESVFLIAKATVHKFYKYFIIHRFFVYICCKYLF